MCRETLCTREAQLCSFLNILLKGFLHFVHVFTLVRLSWKTKQCSVLFVGEGSFWSQNIMQRQENISWLLKDNHWKFYRLGGHVLRISSCFTVKCQVETDVLLVIGFQEISEIYLADYLLEDVLRPKYLASLQKALSSVHLLLSSPFMSFASICRHPVHGGSRSVRKY